MDLPPSNSGVLPWSREDEACGLGCNCAAGDELGGVRVCDLGEEVSGYSQ